MSGLDAKVSVTAEIGGLRAAMRDGAKAVKELSSSLQKTAQDSTAMGSAIATGSAKSARELRKQRDSGKDVAANWEEMAGKATIAGGVMVAAAGVVINKAADFEAAMSDVAAATHEPEAAMRQLSDAALDAGARTVFSATESANAIEELAKAGVSTADILGGALDGSLDLAAAGSLGVADAAEIAATTLTQFNLSGQDMAHVADLLAAGAGKAQGDVQDLSQALKYVGTTASQLGISVEETTGTLALLASNGQLADRAGTGLRGVLMSLTSPSQQARKTMDELGMSFYDNEGKFIGLEGVAGQLHDRLGHLDAQTRDNALGQIFGNAQIETARILYKDGAQAVADWTAKVNDAGYAAETAALKQDNLKGDIEKLGGALDTLMIDSGSGLTGFLRILTQGATTLLDVLDKVPSPLLAATVGLVGLGGAALLVAPRVIAAKNAIGALGPTAVKGARGLAVGTGKLIAFTAAMTALNAVIDQDPPDVAGLSRSLEEFAATGKLAGDAAKLMGEDFEGFRDGVNYLFDPGMLWNAEKGITQIVSAFGMATNESNIKEQIQGIDDALASLAQRDMTQAASVFEKLKSEAMAAGASVDEVAEIFPKYTEAANASQSGGQTAANSIRSVGEAASKAGGDVDSFIKNLEAMIAPGMALSRSTNEQIAAIQGMSKAAQANGNSLNQMKEKGRANIDMFTGLIQTNLDVAAATAKVEAANGNAAGAVEVGSRKFAQLNAEMVTAAVKAGYSEKAINRLVKQITGSKPELGITAKDKTAPGVQKAKKNVNSVKQNRTPEIKAKDATGKAKASAQRNVNAPKQTKTPEIKAKDGTKKAASDARRNVNAVKQAAAAKLNASWMGQAAVNAAKNAIASIPSSKTTTLHTKQGKAGGGSVYRASGGSVWGSGTATSDSIDARLSNGEFVTRTWSADRHRRRLEYVNSTGEWPNRDEVPGFAKGGKVTLKQKLKHGASGKYGSAVKSAVKTYDKRVQTQKDRERDLKQVKDDRASHIAGVRQSISGGSVSIFDLNAYAQAQENTARAVEAQAQAQKDLADARRKANQATSPAERKAALLEMREAQQKYADSIQATADAKKAEAAAKPTKTNIIASAKGKAAQAQTFLTNIKKMQSLGFHPAIIRDVISKGLDEGSEWAAILATFSVADRNAYNAAWSSLDSASASIGTIDANLTPAVSTKAVTAAAKKVTTAKKATKAAKKVVAKAKPKAKKKALGGRIYGPGTETSDSIPIMASKNEYMVRAASAKPYLRQLEYLNRYGEWPQGFALGGLIGSASSVSSSATRVSQSPVYLTVQLDSRNLYQGLVDLCDKSGGTLPAIKVKVKS
ncbi:MAG: phage tail tape measure protein [Candidatus Nanopelagicales bacterium]